ncbi:MAG: flippase-like domain-containing protein [Proteobacteria bacterium]|nr:flippase-like domain-containing protein [Pseudomonadota bacterium]MBU4288102.1 flippase-like domain-containing protein [Pseudomonadota bacterium]MBU4414695.1 flippase-like domain-containing protein [Pseudomonadota bacterium]MCG2757503.1 flippase-like domain-containing protein [Desulfobacteraceae bacterium]
MKRKAKISLALGIIISITAFYFAFRNVPLNELLNYLSSINYFWLFPSVFVVFISFALRTFRWMIILEPACKISFWKAFHPMMIGFMLNCILPGRVGEVARPAILQKKENVPFSTGLATVVAERVFDSSIIIILFAVILASIDIDPQLSISFGEYNLNRETLVTISGNLFKLMIILIGGIILFSFSSIRQILKRTINKIPSLFSLKSVSLKNKIQKFCTSLICFVDNLSTGFSFIKYPQKICICIGLSFIIWGLSAFSFYIMALGCPGIRLSYLELFVVMIIICFFIALPSVPGFWGIWEAGGVFALSLFGIPAKEAAGFTLANHAIQIFPVIIAGVISAMLTGVNTLQILKERRNI